MCRMGGEAERESREEVPRRSFLLGESLQDGVHLLRNGRQRKLKLVLQREERREAARGSEEGREEKRCVCRSCWGKEQVCSRLETT